MEKKLSIGKRMLAFVLTFAMVFTAISWGELGGVKADAAEIWINTEYFTNGSMDTWIENDASSNPIYEKDWKKTGCATSGWLDNEHVGGLKVWAGSGEDFSFERELTIAEAGTYRIGFEQSAATTLSATIKINVSCDDGTLVNDMAMPAVTSEAWSSVQTDAFEVSSDNSTIKIAITGTDVKSGYWANYDNFVVQKKTEPAAFANGDFESGAANWTFDQANSGVIEAKVQASTSSKNTTNVLNLYNNSNANKQTITISQTFKLAAGDYTVNVDNHGDNGAGENFTMSVVTETGSEIASETLKSTTAFDNWKTTAMGFTLEQETVVTLKIVGVMPAGYWCQLDNIQVLNEKYVPVQETVYDMTLTTKITNLNSVMKGSTLLFKANITKDGTLVNKLDSTEKVWFYEKNSKEGITYIYKSTNGDSLAAQVKFTSAGTYTIVGELVVDSDKKAVKEIEITVVEPTYADIADLKAKVSDLSEFTANSVDAWNEALTNTSSITAQSNPDDIVSAYDTLYAAYTGLRYKASEIQIDPVDELEGRSDFIKGIDVSTYICLTEAGVKYKDFDGNEMDSTQFYKLFADQGVNHVRIRIWNDPKDKDGNSYGGGNNDLETAKAICRQIKTYNDAYPSQQLKVLIDFHYSDFWVDPEKCTVPKAWSTYTLDENSIANVEALLSTYQSSGTTAYEGTDKAVALAKFTVDSLTEIKNTGVTIGMVQVGNETNMGMAGETATANVCKLYQAGCLAVKAFGGKNGLDIKRVIHYTDPQRENYQVNIADMLYENGVDYDVFATSFYPYWHGTTSNLQSVLQKISETYNKEVMVAETQYIYTNTDFDGADNQAYENKNNITLDYAVSLQGQAQEIRDVFEAVASVKDNMGIGVYYWEPAWLPVNNIVKSDGTIDEVKKAANEQSWQEDGTGWATDWAKSYDASAAEYGGGGTNCENAALFDPDGNALETLKVFKYVNHGCVAASKLYTGYSFTESQTSVIYGSSVNDIQQALPSEATITYNDASQQNVVVTWSNLNSVANTIKSRDAVGNEYELTGTIHVSDDLIDENKTVTHKIFVIPEQNLLVNGDFEAGRNANNIPSNWEKPSEPENNYQWGDSANNRFESLQSVTFNTGNNNNYTESQKPAASGNIGSLYQKVTIDTPGMYSVVGYAEGGNGTGDASNGEKICINVTVGTRASIESNKLVLTGWKQWKRAAVNDITITQQMIDEGSNTITVELYTLLNFGQWGSWDDIFLFRTGDVVISNGNNTNADNTYSGGITSDSSATVKDNTTVTKNEDGTTTETKTETTTNESGKEVETTVTTTKDADGKVTGSTEVSTIANVAKNTEVTVTVEKDAAGKVAEAAAEVTKKGAETKTGTKGTIAGVVVDQIKEAAGTADIAITTSVTDAKGKEKYSVTVNAGDLVAGEKLTVVVKDEKTGKTVLVDAKQVKVTVNGGVNVVLPEGKDYTLIDTKEAEKVTKEILKTVAPVKKSATLKEGKKATAKLSKKLDMDNVKKITYVSSKKSVATVDQNGKVTAKKAGTVIISIKVTLNNGTTKTVKMKYKVK